MCLPPPAAGRARTPPALCQLKAGAVRGAQCPRPQPAPAAPSWIAHGQQHVGLQLGRLGIEDAFGIAVGKAVQDRLGSGIVAGIVACLGVKKIGVVGELSVCMPGRGERGFRFGIAFVEQVRVAQRQISRGRGIAGVAVRIGGHSRIGFRRAQHGQLLGHGPQLGGGDKGLLDPRRTRHLAARL